MSAELGQLAVILALVLALVQATLPLLGTFNGNARLMHVAHTTAWGQFIFLTLAIACLAHAMLSNCLLYTSPSPRDATLSRMPSSA